ncbi:hypothetical protein [Kocuria rhizophila]|uniref:hypothetical protein n=1 Tax=Kocuria rhizophila TaxID=72000 RepID=UPI00073D4154|nr:hypothetical protein [Kocuria rhizophila]
MSDSLDPELARALQEPARLVRADPALLNTVHQAGSPAQAELMRRTSDAGTVEDRYAAAAMLAALFGHRGPLDQAAHGYGSTPPSELLDLAEVPALRPALRESLSSPVRTGLLEWATTADPSRPPLELAMAARDLGLSDAAVLRSVADRADQVAQGAAPAQRDPLAHFSEVLRAAADSPRDGGAASSSAPGSMPTPQGPAGSQGPAVTTTGIPASEMLGEDELDEPARPGSRYPGEGVPVRDSIAGPGAGAPRQIWEPGSFSGRPADGESRDGDGAARPAGPAGSPDRHGPPVPPREPSTNELYYGVGSDRYADRDPDSEQTRAEDRHAARNWAIVFAVIVAVIVVLVLLF